MPAPKKATAATQTVRIGETVIYMPNNTAGHREPELPAIVTEVTGTSVNLQVLPNKAEAPYFVSNVPKQAKTIKGICWRPMEEPAAEAVQE